MDKMKKFSVLLEELKEKTAVMAFGRCSPPTVGHSKLIHHVVSQKGDPHVFVSHTQDNKKNPLSAEEKVDLLKTAHPEHKDIFHASSKESPTIFHAAAKLHASGYHHLHVVGGADRVDEFKKNLDKYNGVKGPHGYYNFKSIKVSSAGDRDPDSDSVEGMSASKMRAHAKSGNLEEFKKGLHPNLHPQAKEIMDKVSSRLKEDYDRENYIHGNLYKVGDIVECSYGRAEILHLGPNYVTLIKEGKTFKSWVSDITKVKSNNNNVITESGAALTYKGYTTKNLNSDVRSMFSSLNVPMTESFALFNCIVACDKLVRVSKKDIYENFNLYAIEYEKATKYLQKFKLSEDFLSEKEDFLIEYAIENGTNFKSASINKISKLVASAAGINESYNVESTINAACREIKTRKLTSEGWKLVGNMLNLATAANINWDKGVWSSSTQKYMGIK